MPLLTEHAIESFAITLFTKERQARNHLTALVDNGYAKRVGTKYIWIE